MIKLENVSKIYKIEDTDFFALKDINLEIQAGEMVAIMGKSGSGKTTLLNIIGCLDTLNKGNYYLNGESVLNKKDTELAKIRNSVFGFVLQDFSLINHKTALYNVMAPMLFNKTPFKQIKTKAMDALKTVGIESQANKEIVNMSGGQKQRVAIARAIVNNTQIILADEPSGNLDSVTTDEILKIFCELNNQGKTVIIVTHDNHVASFCNKTINIADGQIS